MHLQIGVLAVRRTRSVGGGAAGNPAYGLRKAAFDLSGTQARPGRELLLAVGEVGTTGGVKTGM